MDGEKRSYGAAGAGPACQRAASGLVRQGVRRRARTLPLLCVAAMLVACTGNGTNGPGAGAGGPAATGAAVPSTAPSPAEYSGPALPVVAPGATPIALGVDVLATRPHDPRAFTQGLFLADGVLYESTGLNGESTLRRVDPATGRVLERVDLPDTVFAEGLARVGDRLIQLTWQNRVAFVYDRATFRQIGQHAYDTEGWGLCHDGRRLVMSDGTSTLFFRDPATFGVVGQVAVTVDGVPRDLLNELECVGNRVYANVWQTDTIVRIDPATGIVDAVIDASGLLAPDERAAADVLNGIAWDPAAGTFLITGKLWPKLFEVRFAP